MVLSWALAASRALRYLRCSSDDAFARVFWQYVRLRARTFRYLTLEPGTSGLSWFIRHFARIKPLRRSLEGVLTQCALNLEGEEIALRSLEIRTEPSPSWSETVGSVREVARQAALHHRQRAASAGGSLYEAPEIGLVLHLIKRQASNLGLHGDPRPPRGGRYLTRYGRWYREQQQNVFAIRRALEAFPELLLLLRGLDVAGQELSTPMWPAKPLLELGRAASVRASVRLARRCPEWKAPSFGLTYHAGEDYRRLSEGVRRIHELVEFGLLQPGDRIGHGVALGDDPLRWVERVQHAHQPAEERLDDLLWELTRYGTGDLPSSSGRLELVRAEARRLCRSIYGEKGCDLDDHIEARRLRHDTGALNHLNYPLILPDEHRHLDGAMALLCLYLTDPDVFRRGQVPVEVQASEGEVALLKSAQAWLRTTLARMQVTVESNPSSNLLVGDFRSIDEHPAFRLQPLPSGTPPEGSVVLLSVNDDDPLTFASCLADEFAHMYFALLRRGVGSQEALIWLNQVRDNAIRSRFTIPASADPKELDRIARPDARAQRIADLKDKGSSPQKRAAERTRS